MQVVVFDPTQKDSASAVRGVGRYVSLLTENFPSWRFTGDLSDVQPQHTDVFINPFIDFLHQPTITKRYGKKQIGIIHDLIALKYPSHFPTGIKGKIAFWQNRLALSTYDSFITDSQASKKDILSFFHLPKEKVKVIYPCISNSFITSQAASIKTFNFQLSTLSFFLYVGDATWNKNLVTLAEAIKEVKIPCVFVGKVFERKKEFEMSKQTVSLWEKELFEFFQIVKDDKLFILPGYVPDEELVSLYQKTLCNVLVSRDEGFGFSYLEAASQGSPSLLSDISVFREIAQDAAFFCNQSNSEDIAKQLKQISTEETKRKEICFKAQERAKLFNQKQLQSELQSVISSLTTIS